MTDEMTRVYATRPDPAIARSTVRADLERRHLALREAIYALWEKVKAVEPGSPDYWDLQARIDRATTAVATIGAQLDCLADAEEKVS
jgi:hypothetical protein